MTMISDVLADAVAKIRGWEAEAPAWYTRSASAINHVVVLMDELRGYFDGRPYCVGPELRDLNEDVRRAIAALDISKVVAARDRLDAEIARLRDERNRHN
jgi:hypothetical protein